MTTIWSGSGRLLVTAAATWLGLRQELIPPVQRPTEDENCAGDVERAAGGDQLDRRLLEHGRQRHPGIEGRERPRARRDDRGRIGTIETYGTLPARKITATADVASFNGRLRQQCLNQRWFETRAEPLSKLYEGSPEIVVEGPVWITAP
jgi:hypothetical protein